jgi:hypothetical protein
LLACLKWHHAWPILRLFIAGAPITKDDWAKADDHAFAPGLASKTWRYHAMFLICLAVLIVGAVLGGVLAPSVDPPLSFVIAAGSVLWFAMCGREYSVSGARETMRYMLSPSSRTNPGWWLCGPPLLAAYVSAIYGEASLDSWKVAAVFALLAPGLLAALWWFPVPARRSALSELFFDYR